MEILNDNTSGSTDIVIKLSDYFKDNLNNPKVLKKAIFASKWKLSSFQEAIYFIKNFEKIYLIKDKNAALEFLNSYENNQSILYQRIFDNAKKYLKNINSVLTLSNSKTLLEVFKLWRSENKNLTVYIAKSRPMNEGQILAKALLKSDIKVNLITDAAMSHFIPKVDAVIIGADKILKNLNVVNKTGSNAAAIISKYYKKPFYVLASKNKFTSSKKYFIDNHNPSEVWKYRHKHLRVHNFYFEEIDKKLITKIITEEK